MLFNLVVVIQSIGIFLTNLKLFQGEHIDYCGYSVLPMAIEHDVVIAASVTKSPELILTNFEDCFRLVQMAFKTQQGIISRKMKKLLFQ